MTTFVRQSRTVAKAIDAGRKTGRANIEGSTPAEIQANLLRSLDEFTASIPTTKPQSHVKGSRGANHKKAYFGR
ncbi:hypothetical protein GTU79_24500 [Sodalis ligni]|uniref:hypothetical protein n=1 Tax=Sodalis ligni TaxID=2697027 RepID=UPI00193F264A|nr:hypothetical protein [Sodalis ligni]QWA10350.1 hypothetical protein GTU79_24500 [Sodalis ligni]